MLKNKFLLACLLFAATCLSADPNDQTTANPTSSSTSTSASASTTPHKKPHHKTTPAHKETATHKAKPGHKATTHPQKNSHQKVSSTHKKPTLKKPVTKAPVHKTPVHKASSAPIVTPVQTVPPAQNTSLVQHAVPVQVATPVRNSSSPYYVFIGGNYGLNVGFANTSSNTMMITGGGFDDTAFYEHYQINEKNTLGFFGGAGYKFKPLFASHLITGNAVEVSLSYAPQTYSGTRQEWLSNDYPNEPIALSDSIPFSIKQTRLNLLADYNVIFKPIARNLDVSAKAGLGISSYDYSSSGDTNVSDIVATENFKKTGINLLSDFGFGINYHFAKRYTATVGYDLLILLLPEQIHPTWTVGENQPDPSGSVASGQSSVTLQPNRLINQAYLRLAYDF